MATSILSAGVPITFALLLLAFDASFAQRNPKIKPSLRDPPAVNPPKVNRTVVIPPAVNLTADNLNQTLDTQGKGLFDYFGANAGVGASGGVYPGAARPIWGNAGVNGGVNGGGGVPYNALGQAVAGFGGALGAGVGGLLGSAASIVASPLAIIRPFIGGVANNVAPPVYPAPYQPPPYNSAPVPASPPYYPFSQQTTNNVGMVGWGSYGQNSGSLTYNQCNALWKDAILREATNYDDWKCSARQLPGGAIQACVLTGAIGASPTTSVITTGCGWTMPLFCDDSINDIVYGLRATSPTPAPVTPVGYTYVAGVGTYKVHTELRTWAEAKAACEAEGAHLAVPSTATDYSTLQDLFNRAIPTGNNGGWVGISDIQIETFFQTVTGQPTCTLGQVVFAPAGEPNNGGTSGIAENCVQFGLSQAASLNDAVCTSTLPFVCEITLPARLATCRTSTSG